MGERFENIAAGRSSNVLYFVKTAAAHIQVVTSIFSAAMLFISWCIFGKECDSTIRVFSLVKQFCERLSQMAVMQIRGEN